jgi:predicted RND superfamily exporter protein/GGDEF domain-containing protein
LAHLSLNTLFHRLSWDACLRLIVRRRISVLIVVGALTLFFLSAIPRLVFNTSIYDMVIEDIDETRQYQRFKDIFGSEEIIRVVISCRDVFEEAAFRKISTLAHALGGIEGVRRTISLPDVKKAVDLSGNWPLETFRSRVADVPLFRDNLLSADHRTTLITLVLADGASHEMIITRVQQLIDRAGPDLSLYQMGMPVISDALAAFTERDFFRLPPITFLVVALILFLLFRNGRDVLLPLASVSLALIWTLGFIAMTGLALSILTMIVPVFLIAVGTAYCLHIVSEYRHQSIRNPSPETATLATFSTIAFPTVLAAGTTILGLGSLFVSRIFAIKTFALFACGGMVSFVVIILTFLPATLSLMPLPRPAGGVGKQRPTLVQRLIDAIVSLNLDHRRVTLPLFAVLILVCIFGMLRLEVETNPVDYFRKDAQVRRHFDDIHQRLSGSFPVNVMMTHGAEDYFQTPAAIDALHRFQAFAETLPGVDKAVSFAEYLKLVNYASNRYEPAHYRLPSESFEVRMLVNSYRMMLGQDMLDAFMAPDFSRSNIVLFTNISSSGDFLRLRDRIVDHVETNFPGEITWDVTGFGIVISASSRQLTTGQIKSLSLTMAMVFGIMFMLFLSWKVALIAIVPNLFPIVVNFGIMGWLGIELSMATSLIASVAIGLAVDDTIHYLVRFNREFKTDLDPQRALRTTLNHMGRPIIFTSVTIGIGFAVLIVSGFKPTAIFGAMMAITMFSALVGDLILLPSLMQYVELVTLWDLARIRMGTDPGLEIPLFHGLSRTEMHSILMAGTLRQVTAGQVLFQKGDPSDTMYAVISGRFEIVDFESGGDHDGSHGIQKHINFAGKGDILGELGLLRSAPRSATVVATDAGELLPVNWNVIRRLQWLYPPTALKFFNNLLTILCDRVENLTHCIANESQVDDLTRLCNRKGFCGILEREVSRAARTGQPLTLCRIDVNFEDHQSSKNNVVLRQLGAALAGCIRGGDTLSRIDTRQFVLLITDSTDGNHGAVLKRIQAAADRIRAEAGDKVFSIDLSTATVPRESAAEGDRILECTLSCFEAQTPPR